jgi:acetone carboxylase gamma subunit
VLCRATENVYEHAIVEQVDAASRAPLGLVYAGSEQFVVRSCYCPGCALQFDVQISRRDQPILRATEPALGEG